MAAKQIAPAMPTTTGEIGKVYKVWVGGFTPDFLAKVPVWSGPKEINVVIGTVTVYPFEKLPDTSQIIVTFGFQAGSVLKTATSGGYVTAPASVQAFPIAAAVIGILTVLGIYFAYLTIDRIEETTADVTQSPSLSMGLLLFAVLVFFLIWKYLIKPEVGAA